MKSLKKLEIFTSVEYTNKVKLPLTSKLRGISQTAATVKRGVVLVYNANKGLVIANFIANALNELSPLVLAFLSARVIDTLIDNLQGGGVDYTTIYTNIAFIVLLLLFSFVFSKVAQFTDQQLFMFMDFHTDTLLMKKLSSLDMEIFENPKTNNSVMKAKRNINRLTRMVESTIWIATQVVVVITTLILFIKLNPLIIVIVLIANAPFFIENIVYGKRIWGIWDAKSEELRDYGDTYGYVTSDRTIGEVKIYGIRDFLITRATTIYGNFVKEQRIVETKRLSSGIFLSVLSATGNGLTILIIALSALTQKISVGAVTFYIQNARSLSSSISSIFSSLASIIDHSTYVKELLDVLDTKNTIISGTKQLPSTNKAPSVEFKNVTFRYPNSDKDVLKNFNLTIEAGEHIAIVGKNGAGKTTLIKLLMRFYDVTKGEILINNINIKEYDLASLYKHIATLFQLFNTYHYDAKTNIGMGNIENIDNLEGIHSAAKQAGADEFIQDYSSKYDQILSKRFSSGIDPSYGQWQRIALARAFFKNASILILDEPTSAIDPKAEAEIFERLFEFAKDKSVIIISHRFSTVRNAQRILVIEDGRIAESGSHEELMKNPSGVYTTTFEIQRKGYI